MDYRTFEPPEDLRGLVRFGWSLESTSGGSLPHRLMAETCPNIVVVRTGTFVEADGSRAAPVHLAGALSRATDQMAEGPFSLYGIYLWPWAVKALFQRGAVEFQDAFMALADLLPGDTNVDHWPMLQPEDWCADVVRTLRSLSRDAGGGSSVEQAVRAMLEEPTFLPVEAYALSCGLARRQFERRFKECTGFSPALFMRILRFQRTYRLLERGRSHNLTEVALEAGYFDQSHFIRDFKRFGGMEPKTYFRHAPEKVDNFVRLP